MALYVVQAKDAGPAAMAKARFIKDGFSKPAFLFAQFWLLYHRLWLALAVWIAFEVAFLLLVAPHVAAGAIFAVDILARLFLGFEGSRLRQRRGAAVTDVVEARDVKEAETIFYRRHYPSQASVLPPLPAAA